METIQKIDLRGVDDERVGELLNEIKQGLMQGVACAMASLLLYHGRLCRNRLLRMGNPLQDSHGAMSGPDMRRWVEDHVFCPDLMAMGQDQDQSDQGGDSPIIRVRRLSDMAIDT